VLSTSRHSGQECDFFGQVVHYDPRGAWMLHMVAWDDCKATGGFSCRDAGQLQWHHLVGIARAPAGRPRRHSGITAELLGGNVAAAAT
jgi:hypothetical protein